MEVIDKFYYYKDKDKEILRANNYSMPFAEFSFIVNWWSFLGKDKKLFILISKKDDNIISCAPLMISTIGFLSEINFIGYPLATDMDFIIDEENRAISIGEILDYLYKLPGNFMINLNGIREDSANFNYIKRWAKGNRGRLFLNYSQEPFISRKQSFDQYSKDFLGSHYKKNIARRDRKLKSMGDLEYKKIDIKDIDKIFDIHQDRWKLRYDTSNFSEKKYKEFFKSLYYEKDKNFETDISVITLDKEPVAFCYGFIKNNIYLLYSSSYYDSFSPFGLGQLIKKYKIEECFNNNLSCFSFGVGNEPYKMQWTDNYINIYKLVFKSFGGSFLINLYLLKEIIIKNIKKSHKIIMFRRNKIGRLTHLIKSINKNKIKFFIRKLVKYLLLPLGILYDIIKSEEDQMIILLYHRVNDDIDKELSVKYENFKWHMEYLNRQRYNVISMDEGLDMIRSKKIKGKNVIISFDDGYQDFYINAYPILSRLNYKCILYIAPGFIESGKCYWWDKDIGKSSLLSWYQIQSLSRKDIITIGSHSMDHIDLRSLDKSQLDQELNLSKDKLEEKISKQVPNFSFPQGFINEDASSAVKKIYKSGVLVSNGVNINNRLKEDDIFVLKRVPIQRSDGRYLFIARIKGWLILEEWTKRIIKRLFRK
jgi:peptidoglycan/xylan/chitin deacetylase (PgdA/CDA1 family)